MTDLLITMPCVGRWNVTVPILKQLRRAEDALDDVAFNIQLIGDREQRYDIHVANRWADGVTIGSFEFVSEKHDAVVERACDDLEFDAWMHCCDDDVPTTSYIETALNKVTNGEAHGCRILSSAFIDLDAQRAVYVSFAVQGSGTMLSREALDALDGRPWAGTALNRNLDRRLFENIEAERLDLSGVLSSPKGQRHLVAFKGVGNMWTLDEHLHEIRDANLMDSPAQDIDGNEFLSRHMPTLAEDLELA